jgi:hypothetical protein
MTTEESRLIHPTSIETYDPNPTPALNPQDLAALGSLMATSGMTTLQSRALVAKVQQTAAQTALLLAPEILEEVRKIQEARINEIYQRIMILPSVMNVYVRRDRVLQIVQDIGTRVPRQ